MKYLFSFWVVMTLTSASIAQVDVDSLRINEIQIIASHNSYRTMTYRPIFRWVKFFKPLIPKEYDPNAWDYSHLPMPEQFDNYGVRGVELDVFYDPQGGRYAKRKGNWLVFASAKSRIAALSQPGYKLIHIPDIDYNTHYPTFIDALKTLKNWSDAHPNHLPIFVNVELKSSALGNYIKLKSLPKALPITLQAADSLDAEVRAVFGDKLEKVVTPDKLRGNFATLVEAVLNDALPKVKDVRGKFFFIIDGNEENYAKAHEGLKNRVMFTYASPRSKECVFIKANDAIRQKDSIQQWVNEGFMVRTRCDADTYEARGEGHYEGQVAAFESGAQILTTDYYKEDARAATSQKWSDYRVFFKDNMPIRKNVVKRKTRGNP